MKELDLDSIDVAAYIVRWCVDFNYYVNITKLQKLLYCVYGVLLAEEDTRICREHPKAWERGPVFPRVYRFTTKPHIMGPISALVTREQTVGDCITNSQGILIRDTVNGFGKYSAEQLVTWTHRPESPWAQITENGRVLYQRIPDELIKEYFTGIMEDDNGEGGE